MEFVAQYRGMGWTNISPEKRNNINSAALDIGFHRTPEVPITDYRIVVTFGDNDES